MTKNQYHRYRQLSGSSKFLNSNGIGLNIKASIIGDRIKVNDKLYRMVSRKEENKSIYFFNNKDKRELYLGSNLNQVWKDFTASTNGNGDERRDVEMIQTGIVNFPRYLRR